MGRGQGIAERTDTEVVDVRVGTLDGARAKALAKTFPFCSVRTLHKHFQNILCLATRDIYRAEAPACIYSSRIP